MISNTQQRDRDFLAHAMRLLALCRRQGRRLTKGELAEEVLSQHPDHYYVNFSHAYEVLRIFHRSKQPSPSSRPVQAMWNDLYAKVSARMEAFPKSTLSAALSFVLNFQRPERFYMSRRHAMALLGNCVKTISYAVQLEPAYA